MVLTIRTGNEEELHNYLRLIDWIDSLCGLPSHFEPRDLRYRHAIDTSNGLQPPCWKLPFQRMKAASLDAKSDLPPGEN